MSEHKMEVIYYEMVKMEDRLEKRAEAIKDSEKKILEALERFEILYKDLSKKIEKL